MGFIFNSYNPEKKQDKNQMLSISPTEQARMDDLNKKMQEVTRLFNEKFWKMRLEEARSCPGWENYWEYWEKRTNFEKEFRASYNPGKTFSYYLPPSPYTIFPQEGCIFKNSLSQGLYVCQTKTDDVFCDVDANKDHIVTRSASFLMNIKKCRNELRECEYDLFTKNYKNRKSKELLEQHIEKLKKTIKSGFKLSGCIEASVLCNPVLWLDVNKQLEKGQDTELEDWFKTCLNNEIYMYFAVERSIAMWQHYIDNVKKNLQSDGLLTYEQCLSLEKGERFEYFYNYNIPYIDDFPVYKEGIIYCENSDNWGHYGANEDKGSEFNRKTEKRQALSYLYYDGRFASEASLYGEGLEQDPKVKKRIDLCLLNNFRLSFDEEVIPVSIAELECDASRQPCKGLAPSLALLMEKELSRPDFVQFVESLRDKYRDRIITFLEERNNEYQNYQKEDTKLLLKESYAMALESGMLRLEDLTEVCKQFELNEFEIIKMAEEINNQKTKVKKEVYINKRREQEGKFVVSSMFSDEDLFTKDYWQKTKAHTNQAKEQVSSGEEPGDDSDEKSLE